MMEIAGLLVGLGLLIFMALRGVNVILAALISALIVIITNQIPLAQGLNEHFIGGNLGAFSFAGKFFLLFASGAIFGRIMGDSHAATSIAMALVRRLGSHNALLITVLATAILTYGGVVVFVVIFAIYPLGLRLLEEANIPKRLFCAAISLGAGTFTLTALPGTPSIQNVIPTLKLGTDLFAAPWLGLAGGLIMFVLGYVYLEWQRRKAIANGEVFEPGPRDNIRPLAEIAGDIPHWGKAILPLVMVILIILAPRLSQAIGIGTDSALMQFAASQPILWPSIALVMASLFALALFALARRQAMALFGKGLDESIMPLMATSAVIGFGGVVAATSGFAAFSQMVAGSDLPPLLSMFTAISTISAITGSASGGLQIFMETMADQYLAMGIEPQELHRLVAMGAGGLDSLPHCGAVVAMLTITGLSHRQAYKDVAVVTVVIPVVATLACIALAMAF